MQAMKTTIVIAIIVSSIAFAIESQSPEIPKQEAEQRPCKGKKCSISTTAPYGGPGGGRVIGGTEAVPHSWPWLAYIECEYYDEHHEKFQTRCGGSLIMDKWIATAAHCLNEPTLKVVKNCKILLGKHNLGKKEKTQQSPKISAYFIHENFVPNRSVNGYDLALIKLKKPVKITYAVRPISLPFGLPELQYNKTCFGTGWGRTIFDVPKRSDKLMQLPMTVMDEQDCHDSGSTTIRMICATSWDPNKDLCYGDSGGPFSCLEADGKWYMRGIGANVKKNCILEAYFTKVAYFENWIKNIISHN